jgi:ring-1,2-phenylacetyl-CoA epoxidase subunit PaaD
VVSVAALSRVDAAWQVLHDVLDPEVPALSVCDLGIVRDVVEQADGLEVTLTPTYSGCPATDVIERSVLEALDAAGLTPSRVRLQRAPAWTTDWISDEGKRKLREAGIAPPGACGADTAAPVRLVGISLSPRRAPRAAAPTVACPQCDSTHTEQLSAFGSTACKSLWRCLTCREPFEHFKPI